MLFEWPFRARCAQPAPAIHVLAIARQDPEGFVESGGWNFLDADQSDSEDGSEPESEFEPRYALIHALRHAHALHGRHPSLRPCSLICIHHSALQRVRRRRERGRGEQRGRVARRV